MANFTGKRSGPFFAFSLPMSLHLSLRLCSLLLIGLATFQGCSNEKELNSVGANYVVLLDSAEPTFLSERHDFFPLYFFTYIHRDDHDALRTSKKKVKLSMSFLVTEKPAIKEGDQLGFLDKVFWTDESPGVYFSKVMVDRIEGVPDQMNNNVFYRVHSIVEYTDIPIYDIPNRLTLLPEIRKADWIQNPAEILVRLSTVEEKNEAEKASKP